MKTGIALALLPTAVCAVPWRPALAIWWAGHDIVVQSHSGSFKVTPPGMFQPLDPHVLSNDGTRVAFPIAHSNGTELYWLDLKTKEFRWLWKGSSMVYQSRFSPDGQYLAVMLTDRIQVFDLARGGSESYAIDRYDSAWSLHDDTLVFCDSRRRFSAINASNHAFTPTVTSLGPLIGKVFVEGLKRTELGWAPELDPSGKWAYLGAVSGGLDPTEINGRYYDGIGIRTPYKYGFVDKDGRQTSFTIPEKIAFDQLLPFGWSASGELALELPQREPKVVMVDPSSGKYRLRSLKRPNPDAFLIAFKS